VDAAASRLFHAAGARLAHARSRGQGITAMTYVTRMCLRLYAPAAVLAGSGFALAMLGRDLTDSGPTEVSIYLGYLALSAGVALALWQSLRLLRWRGGNTASCFVCGCLLLAERESRYGIHRRCSGCGKSHAWCGFIRTR
jgi:hypothetical protein